MFIVTLLIFFFFQAEDGIRDLVRSRGLGDVYKRQSSIWSVVRSVSVLSRITGGSPTVSRSHCARVRRLSLIHI